MSDNFKENQPLLMATILDNNYIPSFPFEYQRQYLSILGDEAMYGGAAGGGKSEALLMAALMYVEDPDYAALILRRTYKDLNLPGALMDRAHQWLHGTDAHWNGQDKVWTFPSGATLTFGYLAHENDKYQYQSSEFQFIAFDELTQFTETQYLYLFSRLRRSEDSQIPLRVRSASNPGGVGHQWVRDRFINGDKPFLPASYKDNPYIDQESYEQSLLQLDWITRRQLQHGDWTVNPQGGLFKREWFKTTNDIPTITLKVRFWDLAATVPKPGTDPDYTVGVLLGADKDNIIYVLDVKRVRVSPLDVERLILRTAEEDGRDTLIRMEQEGGASGKIVIQDYTRKLIGYKFRGEPAKKSKEERAKPVSSYAEAGNILLKTAGWNKDFIDELEAFKTEGIHDDQVDSMSGAFNHIQFKRRAKIRVRGTR